MISLNLIWSLNEILFWYWRIHQAHQLWHIVIETVPHSIIVTHNGVRMAYRAKANRFECLNALQKPITGSLNIRYWGWFLRFSGWQLTKQQCYQTTVWYPQSRAIRHDHEVNFCSSLNWSWGLLNFIGLVSTKLSSCCYTNYDFLASKRAI